MVRVPMELPGETVPSFQTLAEMVPVPLTSPVGSMTKFPFAESMANGLTVYRLSLKLSVSILIFP